MAKGKNTAGMIAGLLAGAAVGVAIGMLFAPDKGSKTRKKLKSKADDLKDRALDEYGKISGKAQKKIDEVVSQVKENFDQYKTTVAQKASDLSEEIETELDALK